jgi:hypothetical protein
MRLAILLVLSCVGCPSKEPSSTVPNEVFVTPASASVPSAPTAPVIASAAPSATDASDSSAPLHGPRGKPTSFGGGIPGECINCPPTGCPKSCDDLMKKK